MSRGPIQASRLLGRQETVGDLQASLLGSSWYPMEPANGVKEPGVGAQEAAWASIFLCTYMKYSRGRYGTFKDRVRCAGDP